MKLYKKNFFRLNCLKYDRNYTINKAKVSLFCNLNEKIEQVEEKRKKGKNYNPEIIYSVNKKIKIIDKFPESVKNYLKLGRYDRPIGFMLLFWPCAWGLTLGAPALDFIYFKNISLFLLGSILMRSSGCIINDMWDKDFDKKVERSKDRPIASGKISYKQGFAFLSAHLAISLCILLKLPMSSIIAGLAIMPVVIIYPYMKRLTYFPQFFLGLAFNSGCLIGYFTLNPVLGNSSIFLPLYFGGILWTLIYDTIYAHMDKTDDVKINLKSTAIYFDEYTKAILSIFIILMTIFFYLSLRNNNIKNDSIYPLTLLIIGLLFQFFTIYKVDLHSPLSCLKYFLANNYYGLIIFLAFLSLHFKGNSLNNFKN